MRILVVHNRYTQAGGEDAVVRREVDLLRAHDHDVVEWIEDNARVQDIPALRLAAGTIWSQASYRQVERIVADHRAEVVHFHNTLPLVSPAAYYAARSAGAAVVQTLHNYRLVCPGSLLLRDGQPCEDCVGRAAPWPAIVHGCYRGSRTATSVVASMLSVHRAAGTWRHAVQAYIALTDFVKAKVIAGGIPETRVFVKPNFVKAPARLAAPGRSRGFLFVGRLSPEKGASVLLDAWKALGSGAPPLRIVGDGPQRRELIDRARGLNSVEILGACDSTRVNALMADAAGLIVPSLWYEAFPLVVVEAFASGLPVLASSIGSLASIVVDGQNGVHVTAGEPNALAATVKMFESNAELRARLGDGARATWQALYTSDTNHGVLVGIYEAAVRRKRSEDNGSFSAYA